MYEFVIDKKEGKISTMRILFSYTISGNMNSKREMIRNIKLVDLINYYVDNIIDTLI